MTFVSDEEVYRSLRKTMIDTTKYTIDRLVQDMLETHDFMNYIKATPERLRAHERELRQLELKSEAIIAEARRRDRNPVREEILTAIEEILDVCEELGLDPSEHGVHDHDGMILFALTYLRLNADHAFKVLDDNV